MNTGHEQRARALIGIDGRQYARKPPMYIDVLGLSSVSEAVHEASRMLRIGIMQAMANGIEDDTGTTDNPDRQKSQTDTPNSKISQTTEKDNVSVYSSLTKRARRPIPGPTETSLQESNAQQLEDASSTGQRGSFAPRSWSASKKAGPSILSKRNRSSTVNGISNAGGGSLSVFQPGPKREKHSDMFTRESTDDTISQPAEKKQVLDSGAPMGERSSQRLKPGIKGEIRGSQTDGNVPAKSKSGNSSAANTSKALTSSHTRLKTVQSAAAVKDCRQRQSEIAKPQRVSPSPGMRKVGLPPSWCQVSPKSFRRDSATQPASALSLLRKSGPSKPRPLPAAPKGPIASLTGSAVKQDAKASLQPSKPGKGVPENRGLIPLPSSTGIKVKYVPGSEIIDGVRPNGYTVSIDGVVKPVVTFNPKPKLPHKLRQTSIEKLFQAWRDNRKIAEGEALARALRAEQEMYAKATSRADYRAAVTVKLKDIRKVEN